MRVIVNGERMDIAASDLGGLLAELDYEGGHVAIAVNHHVVPRARWAATGLNSDDQIEIITPRQGG
jgi:sulfur carrier protein